jgi:hypothetical protein
MSENNIDNLWYLADSLTLQDAIALVAGYDPNHVSLGGNYSDFLENFPRLYPVEQFLINAIKTNKLEAKIVATGKYRHVRYNGDESEGFWEPVDEISLTGTIVAVDNLKKWLCSRGVNNGFFFPNRDDIPDFLDNNNKNYSPKLAAAISAWQAVNSNPDLVSFCPETLTG